MPVQKPQLISKPFAANGDRILPPNTASTLVANQDTGYPERQQQPLDENGLPVNRAETNGNFNLYSQHILWVECGGQYTFDQAICDDIGGYNFGAILWCASNNTYQRSLINNNTANFVTNPEYINDGTNWITQGNSSAPTVTTLAATAITGISMILNADLIALGYEGIVSAGFQYRLAGSSVWIDTVFAELDRFQTYNSPITGLTSNTTYEFRAVIIGLDNPGNNAYGSVLTATTQNTSPSDYTINIVGTTPGAFNDALNTTNVNPVINGAVNNDTALVIASANNCTAATREYAQITGDPDFVSINTLYQFAPLKLAIDAATTKDTIVVTSPIAGLLTNGSPLWCDDGGVMKDITTANVVESTFDNSAAAWTQQVSNFNSQTITSVTYGNDKYFACGYYGGGNTGLISSQDGTNWTQLPPLPIGSQYLIHGACYGNGLYLVSTASVVFTSSDLATWTSYPIAGVQTVINITYGNGLYFVMATANTSATSTDGANWTKRTTPTVFHDAVYQGGKWTAVGGANTVTPKIFTSTDAITWSHVPTFFDSIAAVCAGIVYANGKYVCLAGNGDIGTSPDGTTWTKTASLVFTQSNPGTISFGNGIFVVTGQAGQLFTSTDAITWTSRTSSFGTSQILNIGYGNGQFVIVGSAGKLATSDAGFIPKYTCTGLSPSLTNAPTWIAKGGQSFASSVTASSGAPNYVTDTVSTVTRSGDILIASTADRSVSGRYVRLRISLNLNDTASRYYAGFLV